MLWCCLFGLSGTHRSVHPRNIPWWCKSGPLLTVDGWFPLTYSVLSSAVSRWTPCVASRWSVVFVVQSCPQRFLPGERVDKFALLLVPFDWCEFLNFSAFIKAETAKKDWIFPGVVLASEFSWARNRRVGVYCTALQSSWCLALVLLVLFIGCRSFFLYSNQMRCLESKTRSTTHVLLS